MNAVHLTDTDDLFLQEDLHDPDYQSLCAAFDESYRIIKRRRPDIARDLEDKFWSERYQCWNLTECALGEIQDIESYTRPRRKRITVELILRFAFTAGVLAFVIKIRFFSS